MRLSACDRRRAARPRAPRPTRRRAPGLRTWQGRGWRGTPACRRRRCRCRARRPSGCGRCLPAPSVRDVAIDPLLGAARDDVDDLFHRRMAMERVAFARRHAHAHQHQALGGGQAGPAQPLVRAPGRWLDDGVGRPSRSAAGRASTWRSGRNHNLPARAFILLRTQAGPSPPRRSRGGPVRPRPRWSCS